MMLPLLSGQVKSGWCVSRCGGNIGILTVIAASNCGIESRLKIEVLIQQRVKLYNGSMYN